MKFLAVENLNGDILRGFLRRCPDADVVRVQDLEIASAEDPDVLEWANAQLRVLLTHDVNTLVGYFYDRLQRGLNSPGVFFISNQLPTRQVIDDLELLYRFGDPEEVRNRATFFPVSK
jgi:hypothetical protein